jgi:hypothetical protein
MAGVWKVFSLGPLQHAQKMLLPFTDRLLPSGLWAVGVTIPFIQLLARALVIVGLYARLVASALAVAL